jgi:hypothetical protein
VALVNRHEQHEYRVFLTVVALWVAITASIAAVAWQISFLAALLWLWVSLGLFAWVMHTRLPLPGERRPALEPASSEPFPGE